jgi:hypothetical protein
MGIERDNKDKRQDRVLRGSQPDSRNFLGVIPIHRLKAWAKELTSR